MGICASSLKKEIKETAAELVTLFVSKLQRGGFCQLIDDDYGSLKTKYITWTDSPYDFYEYYPDERWQPNFVFWQCNQPRQSYVMLESILIPKIEEALTTLKIKNQKFELQELIALNLANYVMKYLLSIDKKFVFADYEVFRTAFFSREDDFGYLLPKYDTRLIDNFCKNFPTVGKAISFKTIDPDEKDILNSALANKVINIIKNIDLTTVIAQIITKKEEAIAAEALAKQSMFAAKTAARQKKFEAAGIEDSAKFVY